MQTEIEVDSAPACPCGAAVADGQCGKCGWPLRKRASRHLTLPLALVPLIVLLLSGVALAVPYMLATAKSPAPPVDRLAEVPAAPADAETDELLVTTVPGMEGIEPYPEHTDGLTVDEAAQLDEATAAETETRLIELGYVRGAIRWWLAPEERVLYVRVAEFVDADGAADSLSDVSMLVATDASVDAVSTTVPGALAYSYAVAGENSYAYDVTFTKGARTYQIIMVNLDGKPGGEDLLRTVAEEQYRRG